MGIGATELLLIFAVVFLLFGGSRLGALGKGLGEGIANFKKGISGESDEKPSKKKSSSDSDGSSEKKEG